MGSPWTTELLSTCPSSSCSSLLPRPRTPDSPLSTSGRALALSSTWTTLPVSRTGSCPPFRSQLKCHHFERDLTWRNPQPQLALSCRPVLLPRTHCHAKYMTCAWLPHPSIRAQGRIHERKDSTVLALRTVSGTVSLWKKRGWEWREGRSGGMQRGAKVLRSVSVPSGYPFL